MTIDMKSLAREGAKARLGQLETEKNELLRAFPDLRDGDRTPATSQDGTGRGRRQMTAAERRSVSVRMKKYWAERRRRTAHPSVARSSEGPASAKASPPRAGRRLLLLRRNAGQIRKEGKAKVKAVKTSGEDREQWAVPNSERLLASNLPNQACRRAMIPWRSGTLAGCSLSSPPVTRRRDDSR